MKKILMLIGIAVMLSSCLATSLVGSAVGGVVGGAVKATGAVVGGVAKGTGALIGAVIGGNNGEIQADNEKYKFSNAKVVTQGGITTVSGKLSNNKSTKENITISIPCFDKSGNNVGDAVDSISLLEKNKNWEFNATLNSEDVKACKMKDAVVSAN